MYVLISKFRSGSKNRMCALIFTFNLEINTHICCLLNLEINTYIMPFAGAWPSRQLWQQLEQQRWTNRSRWEVPAIPASANKSEGLAPSFPTIPASAGICR